MESSDQLFNPILILNYPVFTGKIPFWEEFYLKTMVQMRLFRLEIPNLFTPKFLYDFLTSTEGVENNSGFVSLFLGVANNNSAKTIFKTHFTSSNLAKDENYTLDLWSYGYWDATEHNSHELNHPLLFAIEKTKQEMQVDDLLLLNKEKSIARTLLGNLFLKTENKFLTNKIEDGVLDDVAREKFIAFLQSKNYKVEQSNLKSYQIQQAESVFVASNQFLLKSVSSYKRKNFCQEPTKSILEEYKNSFNFDLDGFLNI